MTPTHTLVSILYYKLPRNLAYKNTFVFYKVLN